MIEDVYRKMIKLDQYRPEDKMITLIANDYRQLEVLSRFGIPLGFNDKTIREVCESENVDCLTFLTIVNFLNSSLDKNPDVKNLKIDALVKYLKSSHEYFLDFCMPSIRRKLLDAIHLRESDVSFLIIKLFDEYVDDLRQHMEEEENHLFRMVEDMKLNTSKEKLKSEKPVENLNAGTEVAMYSKHHEEVGLKLRELKNIIIKYCPPDSKANLLNAALYDIYKYEEELAGHGKIEDFMLLPALRLRNSLHKSESNHKSPLL